MIGENNEKIEKEEIEPKVIDLVEKTGERKNLKGYSGQYGDAVLRERKAYVLARIVKNEQEEDEAANIVIDGACIRTPEEDIKWEEE